MSTLLRRSKRYRRDDHQAGCQIGIVEIALTEKLSQPCAPNTLTFKRKFCSIA